MKKIILLSLIFLSSCFKNHLYVQHDKLDVSYLASSYVGSPDFRKKHPPDGQRIAIAWDFPLSMFREKLSLILTVRFWDNKEKVFHYKLESKRGYTFYKFQDDTIDKEKKILTYKIDVVNEDGVLIEQWKHHFWKELIEINKEENAKENIPFEESEINLDEKKIY